ncbi:MAG TPA: hypothetical protein VE074_08560 [Jatrophihabitantaceae bacterium]|nr:hypothetical protein [Jatrophihabitantaceae bacterium]
MASPGALRRTWRESSLTSSWPETTEWWTSGVDAVSDALTRKGGDVRAAGEALGRQRAEAGVYLDETRADVRVAARAASLRAVPTAELVDAVTVGWVNRILDDLFAAPCIDPLTELVPVQYLSTRIGELWAEARLLNEPVQNTHTLVIVKAAPVRHPIERETHMITIQMALRSAFRGGETLARMGRTTAAALSLRATERLHPSLAVLRAELGIAMDERRLPLTRFWLESVPRDPEALAALLRDLAV